MARTWTKPEIEAFLGRERLAYQRIDLPFGLSTPGESRAETCDRILADVAGKTVLDVGSYLGYFCQEALRRGAVAAHGIEVDPEKVRQASELAEMNGLAPRFTAADIERCDLDGTYDFVLCLNVLHHLFDPIGVLARLARATRHKLVLELASLNPRDGRKLGLGIVTRHLVGRLPLLYVAPGAADPARRTNAQKYFFTTRAVESVLRHHTKLFSSVEILPSSFKQRFVVIATRRRIRKLLVVGGVTAAGKTTFLSRVADGTLPEAIRASLPPGCGGWPQIGADELAKDDPRARDGSSIDVPDLGALALEYDILRPVEGATHTFERDQAMDLLHSAQEVTVVALQQDPQQLLRQYAEAERAAASRRRRRAHQRHRAELEKQYRDPSFVAAWMRRWKDYLAIHHPGARIVEVRVPSV